MVISVVVTFILYDLVDSHEPAIVIVRARQHYRVILNVCPDLLVGRGSQPNAEVFAFIKKIPCFAFDTDGGCTIRAGTKRLAVGVSDVEAAVVLPMDAVLGGHHVCDIVTTFGKDVICVAMFEDEDIFDPGFIEDWITGIAGSVEAVGRVSIAGDKGI